MARANGQGTLVKRGKIFMAKWVVNGKIYTRTTKCSNRKDAEKKLAEFVKPFQEKTEIEVLENLSAKVRVAETNLKKSKTSMEIKIKFLVDVCINDLSSSKKSEGTIYLYNSMVDTFQKFVNKTYVYEVEEDDIRRFLEDKKKTVTTTTYNHYITNMRMLFNVAMKHDSKIRVNHWDKFNKLTIDKSQRRRELTDEEVKLLCEEADKIKKYNGEVGLLFIIGAYTGLRKSDCCLLKWSSVDFKRKVLNVLPIKTKRTGKNAIIPIHEKLLKRLEVLEHDESGYVLPNLAKLYKKNGAKHEIAEVFKNAGITTHDTDENNIRHITTGFHALRHYFVSNCVRQGIPINVVQKMVAHNTASMSLEYTHVQEHDLQLPDYDGDTVKITLKKTTLDAINKAKGIYDIDEFIMNLIMNKPITASQIKTQQDIELEKFVDEIMCS